MFILIMNIILIDSSYTSFHRFFATLRWFSLAKKDMYKEHKDNPDYDWSKNDIFFEKYKKMYLESIIKLVGKKYYDNSKVVFCLDCPQNKIWRNELTDNYKGGRVDLSKKNNFKPTFKYTYDHLIPNLVKNNKKIFSLNKSKIEADDIIALCVKYIRIKHPELKVYLISGDQDFYQLGYKNLYFCDYKKKEHLQYSRDEAKEQLHLKIINGDCSDNIPNIFPKELKISNKRKKLIRENKDGLKLYLKEYKKAGKIYKLNRQLIDFKYIPTIYHNIIFKKIKKIINLNII